MRSKLATTKLLAGAVVLLLGAGVLHRWVHLSRAATASAFHSPAAQLSNLPSYIGPYVHKQDLRLSSEILRVAGVDDFLYREYADSSTGLLLRFYMGYWGYNNVGMGHGPEVCYPASGWLADGTAQEHVVRFRGIESGAETEATIALHHFSRIRPEGIERLAVGFTAVVDGNLHATSRGVFLHRPFRPPNKRFLAHIHVSTPLRSADWQAADQCILDFLSQLLPHVSTCLFGPAGVADKQSASEETGGVYDGIG